MKDFLKEKLVIVRGGGDLATGTIHKLHRMGFPVIILEIPNPSSIRRYVAFSEAVYEGTMTIEGVTCRFCGDVSTLSDAKDVAWNILEKGEIPLFADPQGTMISYLKPWAVVDAIIAKKNLGTSRTMAPVTVALGPGFTAGEDVDVVVETKRGHNLGRLLYEGSAEPNSGIPGIIAGYGRERVNHAETAGILYSVRKIGDLVKAGETIAVIRTEDSLGDVDYVEVKSKISGVLRGMIRDGYPVTRGFKIADIDPRESEQKNCFTISDKARCIAGGVAEALLSAWE